MDKKFFFILLIAALLGSSAFFLFPDITLFSDKLNLAVCFLIFTTQIAALIFFLTSLEAFKKDLRRSYRILAIGILLFSFIAMQLPIVNIFPDIDKIKLSWAIAASALLSAIVTYVAVRSFAHLLKVRNRYASTWVIAFAAVITGLITGILPHAELPVAEISIDSIFGSFAAAAVIIAFCGVIVLDIRRKLSRSYSTAMTWLAIALFMAGLACIHEVVTKLLPFFNQDRFSNYFFYGISLWPYLATGLLFLKASLDFRKTSITASELPEDANPVDVVNYVAGLISNPAAVDTTLDKVRQITAMHGANSKLSPADESSLHGVYLELEKYLTTKEPLRSFSKEDIRDRLPEQFLHKLP